MHATAVGETNDCIELPEYREMTQKQNKSVVLVQNYSVQACRLVCFSFMFVCNQAEKLVFQIFTLSTQILIFFFKSQINICIKRHYKDRTFGETISEAMLLI